MAQDNSPSSSAAQRRRKVGHPCKRRVGRFHRLKVPRPRQCSGQPGENMQPTVESMALKFSWGFELQVCASCLRSSEDWSRGRGGGVCEECATLSAIGTWSVYKCALRLAFAKLPAIIHYTRYHLKLKVVPSHFKHFFLTEKERFGAGETRSLWGTRNPHLEGDACIDGFIYRFMIFLHDGLN